MSTSGEQRVDFESLRRLKRPRRPSAEACDLCSAELAPTHQHLLDAKSRAVLCSCDACAILFSQTETQTYHRIPRSIRYLSGFGMSDAQWGALNIPIDLAFFTVTGAPLRPVAFYPSPGGAIESLLNLESWDEIVRQNVAVGKMKPEVEALLINRTTVPHEYYLVPIDECYRLVGIIRSQWRGFSGGKEVWQAIAFFFNSLKQRATPIREGSHA